MKGGDLFKLQKDHRAPERANDDAYAHLAPDAFRDDCGRLGEDIGVKDGDVVEIQRRFGYAPKRLSESPRPQGRKSSMQD
jgi:hypothetical protein